MREQRKKIRRKFRFNCKFMEFDEKKHPVPYCVFDNQICTKEKYFSCSNYKWTYGKDDKRGVKDRRTKK